MLILSITFKIKANKVLEGNRNSNRRIVILICLLMSRKLH